MYQLYTLFNRKHQGTPYHVGAREVKKNNKQKNKQNKKNTGGDRSFHFALSVTE